jgi:hypothetical protein
MSDEVTYDNLEAEYREATLGSEVPNVAGFYCQTCRRLFSFTKEGPVNPCVHLLKFLEANNRHDQ